MNEVETFKVSAGICRSTMVAKLVIFLVLLSIMFAALVAAMFLYFKSKEDNRHEKEMRREERNADILNDDY